MLSYHDPEAKWRWEEGAEIRGVAMIAMRKATRWRKNVEREKISQRDKRGVKAE